MSELNAPVKLRCEYVDRPLGIDARRPRLSWLISDARRGAVQGAYEVQAASSADLLTSGKADRWASGKVNSDQSAHVTYDGAALRSRERIWWRVRTWDAAGTASPWSEATWFEMGLLERIDWAGRWIGSPHLGGPYTIPPTPYLRKGFELTGKPVSARLYVTALGIHETSINGKPVSQDVLLPGRFEYAKRVGYHVFDVTALLARGRNAIGTILGDGWFSGHIHSDPRQNYGDRPRYLAQLVVELEGGQTQTIVTDGTWKTTTSGPIRSSDMLMGEDYDARLEIAGWNDAGFDDGKWEAVELFEHPDVALVAARNPPVRKTAEIKPIAPPAISANKRRWIFDLGQNMVGHVRLKVRGAPAGKTLDLRHVEMLDKDGKPYVLALRTARATDHYTTAGAPAGGGSAGGEEVFEPRFTFHGFRYVEVRDCPGKPADDTVTGVVVHTDCPWTGTFECSDPLVNKLQSNITWSQRGNFIDFPTDCPQRDERLGWTGDAQVFCRTAAFNMDVANFFTKWLTDMADAQFADGHIPSTVPYCPSIYHEGGPAWADAAVICPWTIYQVYGDTRLLEERWEMMSRFMAWLGETCPDCIRAGPENKWRGYGDWLSHNAETPHDLIGTAYYAYCATLMSKMAGALGRSDEAERYAKLFETVKAAWQRHYLTPDGLLVAQTQTAYVLALHFDLLPAQHRQKVTEALVRDITRRGMHLSTGFVGTPYLNHVLTDNGRIDVAYALLMQKSFPSWLYPVTLGATTMWERWDGWTPEKGFNDAGMNSYNHYAYGAVGEWMYQVVAGLDLAPDTAGYKQLRIAPRPGGGLTHAKAAYDSVHGRIESGWRIEGGMIHVDVTIPANTRGTIRVPTSDAASVTEGGSKADASPGLKRIASDETSVTYEAGAGAYRFTARYGG